MLSAATCTTAFSAASPNTTLACQPNLPAQRYSAVAGRDRSLAWTAASSAVLAVPWSIWCAASTSGTQSASNIRFLGKPCDTGRLTRCAGAGRVADSTATAVVTEQSSTGGVKAALNTATLAGQFGSGCGLRRKYTGAYRHDRPLGFCQAESGFPNSDAQQRAEAMDGILRLLV